MGEARRIAEEFVAAFNARDESRMRSLDRDDVTFQAPIDWMSFRIGKQQVVWGEADLFRSLDVINPLRLDQNGLIGEDFDDYREPLWIAKGLFRMSDLLGDLVHANTFVEAFYSPNWRPLTHRAIVGEGFRKGIDRNNTLDGLSYPTYLPFRQVRHPWEISRVGEFRTAIEALTGEPVGRVVAVNPQFDEQQPFTPQVAALLAEIDLTPAEWQGEPLLVVLPSLNFIAALVLAELHGRMGYFPPVVRTRPLADMLPRRYEVAELLDLQGVREAARRLR